MAEEDNESGDYTRFGIPDTPRSTVTTVIGKTRTWAGLQWKEKLFLVFSLVNILAAIGLTTYRLVDVARTDTNNKDFTFTILIIVNAVFVGFYTFHGVLRERKYELYVQALAILLILVYCIVEYVVNTENRNTVKLVRLIIACVAAPPNIVLALLVARDFGELEFRIAGASENLQKIYKDAAIFSCWLKFDLQVTISLVILALQDGTSIGTLQKVTLGVGIPFTLFWGIFGWFMLRLELKWAVPIFVVLGLGKPTYYIFKFITEYDNIEESSDSASVLTYCVLVCGAIASLVWVFLMVELYIVVRNFGQGLKERGKVTLQGFSITRILGVPN